MPYPPMPQPTPPPKRKAGRKILFAAGIFAALAVGSAVAVAGGGPATAPGGAVATPPTTWTSKFDATTAAPAPAVEPAETATEAPQFPPQVAQARDSAQSYLELKGFSRDGLIAQLTSEYADQYPKDVATQAVDSLDVDWNAQAAKSAKSYLDLKGFSCAGLIDQLTSEYADKFTTEQATYGAHQTDACK